MTRTATTADPDPTSRQRRRFSLRSPGTLWTLLVLQGVCTVFFVFDATADAIGLREDATSLVQSFEYVMAFALAGGVVLTAVTLRDVLARHARLSRQVAVASGAFETVLETHFDEWALTPSERDVAKLAIKGLSIADMAELRGTAEGTIKAHSAAVYRKAGVSGRLQLISYFVEELMGDPVLIDRMTQGTS